MFIEGSEIIDGAKLYRSVVCLKKEVNWKRIRQTTVIRLTNTKTRCSIDVLRIGQRRDFAGRDSRLIV